MTWLLLLASLANAQEVSTNTTSATIDEQMQSVNMRKAIRDLASGNYRQTGKPKFANGFCFGDGTCQTAASGSILTSSQTFSGLNKFTATTSTNSQVNTLYAQAIPKAWVVFTTNGCSVANCTITGSFNVNLAKNTGTGVYEVYFYTPMANSNYAPLFICGRNGASIMPSYRGANQAAHLTTTKAVLHCSNYDGSAVNSDTFITAVFFGDQ